MFKHIDYKIQSTEVVLGKKEKEEREQDHCFLGLLLPQAHLTETPSITTPTLLLPAAISADFLSVKLTKATLEAGTNTTLFKAVADKDGVER